MIYQKSHSIYVILKGMKKIPNYDICHQKQTQHTLNSPKKCYNTKETWYICVAITWIYVGKLCFMKVMNILLVFAQIGQNKQKGYIIAHVYQAI